MLRTWILVLCTIALWSGWPRPRGFQLELQAEVDGASFTYLLCETEAGAQYQFSVRSGGETVYSGSGSLEKIQILQFKSELAARGGWTLTPRLEHGQFVTVQLREGSRCNDFPLPGSSMPFALWLSSPNNLIQRSITECTARAQVPPI